MSTEQDKSTDCHKSIPTGSTNLIPSTTTTTSSTSPETEVKESKSTDDVNKDDDDNKMESLPDDEKFKERIKSSLRTVQSWETVEWIKDCRAIIPWEDLRNATGPYSRPEEDRALVEEGANAIFLQRFCRWFPKIMTWVNAPPCAVCGSKDCEMKTVRGPETEEEIEGNAKRVEGKSQNGCLQWGERGTTPGQTLPHIIWLMLPIQYTTARNATKTQRHFLGTTKRESSWILERVVAGSIPISLDCSAALLALKLGSYSI